MPQTAPSTNSARGGDQLTKLDGVSLGAKSSRRPWHHLGDELRRHALGGGGSLAEGEDLCLSEGSC